MISLLSSDTAQYKFLINRIDCAALLDHYGAKNITRKGDEIWHSCLIDQVHRHHTNGDESPSASLNVKMHAYHCWSYGGGDILWLIGEMEDCTRSQALNKLGQFLNNELDSEESHLIERIKEMMNKGEFESPMPTYHPIILKPWLKLHPYMTKDRGISKEVLKQYKIGYDEEDRTIVIPHFFEGKLVGYQKRRLDPPYANPNRKMKYKNTTDFPKDSTLFNYDIAKDYEHVIVVESVMSVLKAASFGLLNVVATFSGSVTDHQLDLLKNFKELTLYFDDDLSGYKGTQKVYNGVHDYAKVYIVQALPNEDLGDLPDLETMLDRLEGRKLGALVINKYRKKIEEIKLTKKNGR